jgi:outer membrane protein TolC
MRATALLTLFLAATCSVAHAAPRRLTLGEAVQLALKVEPLVAEARIQDDRAKLGVLRAQLDRFSLKIDGSVQELWNKTNIGGPAITTCSDPSVPSYLCGATYPLSVGGTPTSISFPGMFTTAGVEQSPSQWTGLSNLSANLNYYLFSGFRVEANVTRAKKAERAALVQIRQQQKDIALAVARAYWQVRRLTILRQVQQAALQRMLDAEAVADGRVRAGLAPPIDRNRATARKLTQMATLEDLTGQARVAAAQLGVVLGLPDDLELVDEVQVPDAAPPTPVDLVREALGRRPEVQNARLQVEVQHQLVRMARANFFPQITLLGLFQYGNNPYSIVTGSRNLSSSANPFGNLSGSFTVGGTLTLNFFDTLNTYTATGDARYLEKVAWQETRRYERLVDSDVRTAHANLQKLYARRAPLMRARDVARDNLSIIEGRYKNGDALVIEYLDAQIELANAELALADVTAQLQLQWYELQAALGFTVGVDHG